MSFYDVSPDPYCYPESTVLKNRLGIRDQAALDAFETIITDQRAAEPLPNGRLGYAHYRAIHRHLFQDVFSWAGKLRTVRTSKGGSTFCYPENIDSEMRRLFNSLKDGRYLKRLSASDFAARVAHLLAELNAIHCFREGNGRTQLSYFTLLATSAGHPPALDRMNPQAMMKAMIDSFHGDESPLVRLIDRLIAK